MLTLNQQLDQWHLLKHPFYVAWTEGKLSHEDLETYACQYYHQVNAFPRYVSATHSNADCLADRQVLLENLIEEEYGEGNHPALWLKFAESLGLSEIKVKNTALFPETQTLINTFLSTCQSSYAEGLGALYAYERQVPEVAASKISGLALYNISAPEHIKFFTVHIKSDVEHTKATTDLIQKLNADNQQKAYAAANKIARSVWDLLSGIYERTIGLRVAATV